MNKADKPVVDVKINGDNNNVEVNVKITETSSKTSAAIHALGAIVGAAVLAISQCCPELFTDFVRSIISMTIGS